MDTLVNTAKIGLEAQIKQIRATTEIAASNKDDSMTKGGIQVVQQALAELKEATASKLREEAEQRRQMDNHLKQEADTIKNTFVNRLNMVEK